VSTDLVLELATAAAAPAGLQLSAMPRSSLNAAVRRRQTATGYPASADYTEFARDNAAELDRLLEELLVHETFFFRDAQAFAEMRRWCLDWLCNNPNNALRILSAPCATGEEPYSLAAMLWEAGVSADRYRIDAADISAVALMAAQAAVYGRLSLRGLPRDAAPAFLNKTERGWTVRPEVRSRVRFRRVNLVGDGPDGAGMLLEGEPYHLICTRNLLLYQTSEAKARLIAGLSRALYPGGRLVIGAADWCQELAAAFDLTGPPEAFALKHRSTEVSAARRAAINAADVSRSLFTERAVADPAHAHLPETVKLAATVDVASIPSAATFNRNADAQREEEQVNGLHHQSKRALTQGRWDEAERLCRQALYLDSSHLPSLELLSRIWAPRMPERFRYALEVRIRRHRSSDMHASTFADDAARKESA
jgi:chemotaxis protein methyltransferase WspC